MKSFLFALSLPILLSVFSSPARAADDPLMGNWEGVWKNSEGKEGKLTAQIIALGNNAYQMNSAAHVGDEIHKLSVNVQATESGGAMTFTGKADNVGDDGDTVEFAGDVKKERIAGRYETSSDRRGEFVLEKVYKKSPTLGAKPPNGAVVLFGGKSLEDWHRRGSDEMVGWKVAGGVAEVVKGTGDIVSNAKLGDHKLHVEFRTPFMPEERGQGRGNSGVYVQGRYEVQVLDSFGLEGLDNECGGIYKQYRPKVNACLPPGEWQTYDITFHAARVDDAGKVAKPARLTVVHNGILIHDNVSAKGPSAGGFDEGEGGTAPLLLQDHGNPVQYRNIWALPLKAEAE